MDTFQSKQIIEQQITNTRQLFKYKNQGWALTNNELKVMLDVKLHGLLLVLH